MRCYTKKDMLIEVRIGPGKRKLTESISRISHLCGTPVSKIHRVPHISLYGSFAADYQQVERVKEIMTSIGKRYSFLPYLIDGFRWIHGRQGRVIYFNIVASEEFQRFRHELAQRLLKVVPRTRPFDKHEDFLFHSTLAYKLDSREFESIWSYVSSDKALAQKFSTYSPTGEDYHMRYFYLPLDALRVTLLNDQSRVICEYDFTQQRLLTRGESQDASEWGRTLKLFRIARGIEGNSNVDKHTPPYIIGDLHLDHTSIIHHCARPFNSANVGEMNTILIDNWNYTVDNNEIYFLGNLAVENGEKNAANWLEKLHGNVHFIRGEYDNDIANTREYDTIKLGRYSFLLIHDPDRLPINWGHWVIHGHKHNNDIKNYPFINGERKTINVSPELISYRPLSLEYLTSLKLSSIKRMDTIDSIPVMR
ncbi:MAG: 2'-5' RNA ligase family protein [Dehalococcoidia bacterium]|nr:2'-5' RNA ligase family protein [Dehalococcoidia bacterium]